LQYPLVILVVFLRHDYRHSVDLIGIMRVVVSACSARGETKKMYKKIEGVFALGYGVLP
jgi:hypothetical protein